MGGDSDPYDGELSCLQIGHRLHPHVRLPFGRPTIWIYKLISPASGDNSRHGVSSFLAGLSYARLSCSRLSSWFSSWFMLVSCWYTLLSKSR